MIVKDLKIDKPGEASFMVDDKRVWMTYDSKYDKYLDTSNYDGVLIYVLPLAMHLNERITIQGGKVSYKLYKNVTRYIMYMLKSLLKECPHIVDITCDEGFIYESNLDTAPTEVGLALSCGADSLCCLEDYYYNYNEPDKITIAANFDAGADIYKNTYEYRRDCVEKFVNEHTTLGMFTVLTNFPEVNNIEHHDIHVLRNLSVPLFFQPLFKKFYYGSGQSYPDNHLLTAGWKLSNIEVTHILGDPMIIPLLSTYNLEFELHGAQYRRYEKIRRISQNPVYDKHLNVCVARKIKDDARYVNCSKCEKCIITLCAMDYYNILDQYSSVFNVSLYQRLKRRRRLRLNRKNPSMHEIIELNKTSEKSK